MGANAQQATGGEFLSTFEGKMYLHSDKERSNPIGSLTGKVTDFYFQEEEFNGAKVEKMYLVITDDKNYKLGLKVGSKQYAGLISFFKNANLTQEIEIVPKATPLETGKIMIDYLVKQNGSWMKSFYSKNGPNTLPQWEKVKVGKQEITDKSAYEDALREVVEKEFLPVVKGNAVANTPSAKSETPAPQDVPDDLPF